MLDHEEKQLLKDLAGIDGEHAFETLYNRYAGKCCAFIKSMTKDEKFAMDLTQDIFIKVWLKRDLISKADSFLSYLFRMTRNAIFDYFEHNAISRKYIAQQIAAGEEFKEYVEEKMDLRDLEMMIFKTVSEMPERRREVFTLSRYKGLSNTEIATSLNISIRTVENHLSNALSDLRVALSNI